MKTEEEEQSDYDFGSRESSAQVTVKEFSFPLSPVSSASTPSTPLTTWPYSTLLTPQSLVSPSQLVLGVKRSSSPASSSTTEPPAKKVKRKARTEEEKQASANERIMRNRRAAQESRDRKKRQLESLEEENRRLQQENATMRRRIEQLESQQSLPTLEPASDIPTTYCDVIKEEVFSPESFESTFHPAVSLDLSQDYTFNLDADLDDFVSPVSPVDDNLSATALLDTFLNDDSDLFDEREACSFSCDV